MSQLDSQLDSRWYAGIAADVAACGHPTSHKLIKDFANEMGEHESDSMASKDYGTWNFASGTYVGHQTLAAAGDAAASGGQHYPLHCKPQ